MKHFIAELFLAQDEEDKEACRKSAVALGMLGGINNEDFFGSELPYFLQEGPGKYEGSSYGGVQRESNPGLLGESRHF